jgi:hypothetical protein
LQQNSNIKKKDYEEDESILDAADAALRHRSMYGRE